MRKYSHDEKIDVEISTHIQVLASRQYKTVVLGRSSFIFGI
jgi:hypothetical protein